MKSASSPDKRSSGAPHWSGPPATRAILSDSTVDGWNLARPTCERCSIPLLQSIKYAWGVSLFGTRSAHVVQDFNHQLGTRSTWKALLRPTRPWVGLHNLMTGSVQKWYSCLNAHVWRYLCLHFRCAKADGWQHLNGSSSFYPIQRSSICGSEFPSQFKHPQVVIFITWRRKRLRGHMEGSSFRWMPEDRHCSSFF